MSSRGLVLLAKYQTVKGFVREAEAMFEHKHKPVKTLFFKLTFIQTEKYFALR